MTVTKVGPNVLVKTSAHNWVASNSSNEAANFHKSFPGYAPTQLIEVPQFARELGVGKVFVKDESARFGLPAFKALGATWAINQALIKSGAGKDVALVCATDGNHGRAVARTAKSLGHPARIYIPDGVSDFAIQAIADEGAQVIRIYGDYDLAVASAAKDAAESNALLIQDTAWDGYEDVPSWIVQGYTTMVTEVDEQLANLKLKADLVIVPTGVGSLLQAVIAHYRAQGSSAAKVVSVEPVNAGGVFASLEKGELVSVQTETTIMAGLNCGTPSSLAMPFILSGLSGAVLVDDQQARQGLRDLTELGVIVGPCGAAALSGIRTLINANSAKSDLGLTEESVVVLLSTESAEANPI